MKKEKTYTEEAERLIDKLAIRFITEYTGFPVDGLTHRALVNILGEFNAELENLRKSAILKSKIREKTEKPKRSEKGNKT